MKPSEVRIGFGKLGITVYADDPRILTYVGRAYREFDGREPRDIAVRFEVTSTDGVYGISLNGHLCGRESSIIGAQRRLGQEIIRHLIGRHQELLWLHAGAVANAGKAMLLVGRFGAGKSTFTAELAARNWRYFSDDVAPVDVTTSRVLPFPLMPMVRTPIDTELPLDRLSELRKQPREILPQAIGRDAAALGVVVFPEYRHGAPCSLTRLPPAEAALRVLQNCTSYEHDGRTAVAASSKLAAAIPAYSLRYGEAQPATDLLESLMHAPSGLTS